MAFEKFLSIFSNSKTTDDGRVVGIDIGSSSIKVVELQDKNGIITLNTYGELQLGPYEDKVVGETASLSSEAERQAMVDILRESAVKAQNAVFAMPLASSFVTTMSLPALEKEDVSSRVRVEARKYIPVPISEVTLDWAEVDTKAAVGKTSRDILVAAIQNNALNRFKVLLESLNFAKPPTEIECFSTIRSLYSARTPDIAIIDIGAQTTKFYIVHDGMLQRMYRVKDGGSNLTIRLAKEKDLSFLEAEILKQGLDKESADFPLAFRQAEIGLGRSLREFRQVLEEYEARSGAVVKQIVLTGGAASFPDLDRIVNEGMSREVIFATPFDKVAYPAFMADTLQEIGTIFTPAIGAALRYFE